MYVFPENLIKLSNTKESEIQFVICIHSIILFFELTNWQVAQNK